MGAKVRQKKQEAHGNIFWVTMSDLFIGMFMIFATLFFAFSMNTGQGASAEERQATREVVEVIAERLQEQCISAVKQAENGIPVGNSEGQFEGSEKKEQPEKDTPPPKQQPPQQPPQQQQAQTPQQQQQAQPQPQPQQKADVEIDPFTGMARISDLELFKLNSAELTPKGKEFLSKFIPIYLDTILSSDLKKYLVYIVIQGHTDSHLFKGVHSPQEQYMLNMNLSMNRAYNVANYIFLLSKNKPYYKDLTRMIRVEGASFSSTLKKPDGKEDYNRSRRVELRLVLKEQRLDVLQQFFNGAKSNSSQGAPTYEKL